MSHKAWSLSVTQKQELQHTGLNSKLLFACGEVYGTRFLMQHLSARFWQPIQGKKKKIRFVWLKNIFWIQDPTAVKGCKQLKIMVEKFNTKQSKNSGKQC